MATNVNVPGTVKFFSQEKGFGFIQTSLGDVFIHASKTGGMQTELVQGAEVHIDFITAYSGGDVKRSVTSLLSVKAPAPKPQPVEVLDTVIWFDPSKGYGFIHCGGYGLSREQAHLHVTVAERAGIIPGEGMPIRARVVEAERGPKVISFKWGEEVDQAYQAKLAELHAEDGASQDQSEPAPTTTPVITDVAEPAESKKPKKRRASTATSNVTEAATTAEATQPKPEVRPKRTRSVETPTELFAHKDPDTPNCALAGLAALTGGVAAKPNGNGSVTHH